MFLYRLGGPVHLSSAPWISNFVQIEQEEPVGVGRGLWLVSLLQDLRGAGLRAGAGAGRGSWPGAR